jgi:hypothetical protein
MASAVVCRAVLMFELSGLRSASEEQASDGDYALVGLQNTATDKGKAIDGTRR